MWGFNKNNLKIRNVKETKVCVNCIWFSLDKCAYIGSLCNNGEDINSFKLEPACELFETMEPGVGDAIINTDIKENEELYDAIDAAFDGSEPTKEMKKLLHDETKPLERAFEIDKLEYLEQGNTIVIKLNNEIFTSIKYENGKFIIESWYGRLVIPADKINILGEKLATIIRAVNVIRNVIEFNG